MKECRDRLHAFQAAALAFGGGKDDVQKFVQPMLDVLQEDERKAPAATAPNDRDKFKAFAQGLK